MTSTPAFARWSLGRACDYRQEAADPFEPAAVERELRPLQEASLALAEGRVAKGFAFSRDDWNRLRSSDRERHEADPADALVFSLDEILDYYGGEESANATCRGCPANAGESLGSRWAGCFGLAMPDWERTPEALDEILEASGAAQTLDAVFVRTVPRWYGWWIDAAWDDSRVRAFLAALDATDARGRSLGQAMVGTNELRAALRRSGDGNLVLRTVAFPPGRIEGRSWHVDAHCPRCKAPADAAAKFCGVCRRPGGMFPQRSRKVRGERPYRELGKLLSRERSEALLRAVVEHGAGN